MTQEEKARAYDEAIKRAKEWEGNPAAVEYIFPELAESGDERIRKELVDFIKRWKEKANDFTSARALWTSDEEKCDKYLAWLEKQGEQKSVECAGDERVRNYLLKLTERCPDDSIDFMSEVKKNDIIAWLEKQGDVSKAYELGFTEGMRIKNKEWLEKQKPVEWSEEDDIMVEDILDSIDDTIAACDYHEMESWLKSLKQRIKE